MGSRPGRLTAWCNGVLPLSSVRLSSWDFCDWFCCRCFRQNANRVWIQALPLAKLCFYGVSMVFLKTGKVLLMGSSPVKKCWSLGISSCTVAAWTRSRQSAYTSVKILSSTNVVLQLPLVAINMRSIHQNQNISSNFRVLSFKSAFMESVYFSTSKSLPQASLPRCMTSLSLG